MTEKKPEAPQTPPAPENPLAKAQEEAKANHDKWLRAAAEFENYKKRIAKDQKDLLQYGQEKIFHEFLVILDDFDRVLDHLPAEKSPTIKGIVEGVEHVHRHFTTILKKHGVTAIETKGQKFDPHFHEALAQVESANHAEGEVVEVKRKGYQIHERLLRPALVTVAKGKLTQSS